MQATLAMLLMSLVLLQPGLGQNIDYSPTAKKINKKFRWYDGEVIFRDGFTLEGAINFNPLTNEGIIRIKDGDQEIAGNPYNVISFSYLDEEKRIRNYTSVPVSERNNAFCEIIYDSDRYIFCGRHTVAISRHHIEGINANLTVIPDYTRILIDLSKNKVYEVDNTIIVSAFKDQKKELKRFIKANNLDLARDNDYTQVIIKYEALSR